MKSKHALISNTKSINIVTEFTKDDIVFSDNLSEVMADRFSQHAIHVICDRGSCVFKMSGKKFEMKEGDFVIWPHGQLVSDIETSSDFVVTALYISYQFFRNHMPNNNYDIIGNLSLLQNPVLSLTEKEKNICHNDFIQIKLRLPDTSHHFYAELLGSLVITVMLDMYDIHARINKDNPVSEQNALLLRRFIKLLESGEYIKNREVANYADKLFVSPKYLSEVCKKVTGYTTTVWIDRFTITEITRLLRNKKLPLTEITEIMNFSSLSYFSRYVQRNLGVSPTEYRQR